MEITFISDTHNRHREMTQDLTGGPILVHCGDVSMRGSRFEIDDFLEWFSELPYMHKIMVPGNHDFFFDWSRYARTPHGKARHGDSIITKEMVEDLMADYPAVHLLNDSGITVEGINFWGSPITPWFHDWAFNRWEEEIGEHWKLIPDTTDVLITHGPPFGILDKVIRSHENVGCKILSTEIARVKPRVHAFGHIHEEFGTRTVEDTLYISASMIDIRYEYTNKPTVINL
jgi:predicted phosphodiesterase